MLLGKETSPLLSVMKTVFFIPLQLYWYPSKHRWFPRLPRLAPIQPTRQMVFEGVEKKAFQVLRSKTCRNWRRQLGLTDGKTYLLYGNRKQLFFQEVVYIQGIVVYYRACINAGYRLVPVDLDLPKSCSLRADLVGRTLLTLAPCIAVCCFSSHLDCYKASLSLLLRDWSLLSFWASWSALGLIPFGARLTEAAKLSPEDGDQITAVETKDKEKRLRMGMFNFSLVVT